MLCLAVPALAHSGRTDGNGGHYNRATGEYHYHHGYPEHQHPGGVCPYDYHDDTDPYGGDSPDVGSNDRPSYLDLSDEEWDALAKSIKERQDEVRSRYTWRKHKNKNATATPTVTPSPSPSPTPSPSPSPTPTPTPSPSLYPSPNTEDSQGDMGHGSEFWFVAFLYLMVIIMGVFIGKYIRNHNSPPPSPPGIVPVHCPSEQPGFDGAVCGFQGTGKTGLYAEPAGLFRIADGKPICCPNALRLAGFVVPC